MQFPDVTVNPDEPLEAARQKVIQAFQKEGTGLEAVAAEPLSNLLTELLDISDFVSLLAVIADDALHVFFICPFAWTEERYWRLLDAAVRLKEAQLFRKKPVFHLLSGYPIPEGLIYLLSDTPCGAFALDALAKIQEGVELSPETAPKYAEITLQLVEEHFGERWAKDEEQTLERIDDLVLRKLKAEGRQRGYVPTSALIGLGCLAGEVIMEQIKKKPGWKGRWIYTDSPAASFGLALEVSLTVKKRLLSRPRTVTAKANPIDKVFKLFTEGKEHSIAFFYHVLQTILEQEISKQET